MARARCKALLTAGTLVSSKSAASVACHRRTSHRMRTARWRGGQVLEGGNESQADAIARALPVGPGRPPAATPGRRRWGDPGPVGQGWQSGSDSTGGLRRSELHRAGPALAASEDVQAHVGGNAVQPRSHARPPFETPRRPPGPDHGLLDRIVGVEGGAEHPVAVPGELTPIASRCSPGRWYRHSQRPPSGQGAGTHRDTCRWRPCRSPACWLHAWGNADRSCP